LHPDHVFEKFPSRMQKYAYGFFCAIDVPWIQPLEKHEEELDI
jgi:hypothetical protein